MKICKRIPFLEVLDKLEIQEIIYFMNHDYHEKGSVILRKNSLADSVIIVENGCVEVVIEFEGNKFVIDRLYRGSIINYRLFLIQERVSVSYISSESTFIYQFTMKQLKVLEDDSSAFSKHHNILLNRYLTHNVDYPLDYIYGIPENQPLPESL